MKFGSYEWHLKHNAQLAKCNAMIYLAEYRNGGKPFNLQYAFKQARIALKLKKQIRGMV